MPVELCGYILYCYRHYRIIFDSFDYSPQHRSLNETSTSPIACNFGEVIASSLSLCSTFICALSRYGWMCRKETAMVLKRQSILSFSRSSRANGGFEHLSKLAQMLNKCVRTFEVRAALLRPSHLLKNSSWATMGLAMQNVPSYSYCVHARAHAPAK